LRKVRNLRQGAGPCGNASGRADQLGVGLSNTLESGRMRRAGDGPHRGLSGSPKLMSGWGRKRFPGADGRCEDELTPARTWDARRPGRGKAQGSQGPCRERTGTCLPAGKPRSRGECPAVGRGYRDSIERPTPRRKQLEADTQETACGSRGVVTRFNPPAGSRLRRAKPHERRRGCVARGTAVPTAMAGLERRPRRNRR
jgi:hypothetical protein